jgi:hypothetical protein
VLAWSKQGVTQQRLVRFGEERTGTAVFELEEQPQEPLRLAVGPESATPFELQRLQTLAVSVPASSWKGKSEALLKPIQISAYHWWWWQHWRQSFKVSGRVVSSGGVPVVGVTVSAFDIDAWWWWTAQERVGEATTDDDGGFALEFTRASGWWPWWWWATRTWQANAEMVGRITAFVGQYPQYGALAAPTAEPSLEVFESLLAASPRPMLTLAQPGQGTGLGAIEPAALESLRERLVEILPRNFPLPVWPWVRWAPWEDCGANLIFKVTDRCGDETTTLLNETASETRWEIPARLDVTLTTREARFGEKRPGWTLVDHLFPAGHSAALNGRASEGTGAVLGGTA